MVNEVLACACDLNESQRQFFYYGAMFLKLYAMFLVLKIYLFLGQNIPCIIYNMTGWRVFHKIDYVFNHEEEFEDDET